MVSLRRRRGGSSPSVDTRAPAADRPVGEWAGLPPVRTVTARSPAGVLAPADFRDALATTWSAPPALQPLGHHLSLDAPGGLIPAQVAPVPAYDGASLRFAPAVGSEQAATSIDWTLPRPAPRSSAAAEQDLAPTSPGSAARPSLLDRVLRRTASPAPAGPEPRGQATGRASETVASVTGMSPSKGAEEQESATVVPAVPVVEPLVPSAPVVRPLDVHPERAQERRGPAQQSLSDRPAGPRRFAPAVDETGTPLPGLRLPSPRAAAPTPRLAPRSAPADLSDERSGPAEGPEGGPIPGPLRSRAAAGDEPPNEDLARASAPHVLDSDAEPTAQERSGPVDGPESGPITGPLRFDDGDDEASYADEGAAETDAEVAAAPAAARRLPPTDIVRAAPPTPPRTEERTVLGQRRPLGAELLDAGRAAALPRPVAALAPAALPDPVAARPAAGSTGPAPSRPAGFTVRDPGHGRPAAAPGEVDTHPAAPRAGADAEPGTPVGQAELRPGLPDWWPDGSGTWSVRDVDPFQTDAAPPAAEPADVGEPPQPVTRATAVADDVPVLRQRVRPTTDPVPGTPVGRRVPWPADGGLPVLRQVRRPGAATALAEHAAGRRGMEAGLGLPSDLALPDLDTPGLPAPPADRSEPSATTPTPPPAAAAPTTAGPSPEDLADQIRHALLVERERSGALADQW